MFVPRFDLSWANTIYVKPPTTLTERVSSNTPEVYRSYDYGTYTQWDTSLRWQPTFAEKHRPYIKLDVLNVLNKTRKGAGPNGQDLGIYTPVVSSGLKLVTNSNFSTPVKKHDVLFT